MDISRDSMPRSGASAARAIAAPFAPRSAALVQAFAAALALCAPLAVLQARAEVTDLSPLECGIAGQVAYAAALIRDNGGDEVEEHSKIDGYIESYPRRDLWRLTHNIVAWTYQNPALSPRQIGNGIMDSCAEHGGKISFVGMESM